MTGKMVVLSVFCLGLLCAAAVPPKLWAGEPVWDVVYQGIEMPKAPWKMSPSTEKSGCSIKDGRLYLVDRDNNQAFCWYGWNADPDKEVTVEARVKIIAASPGGVSISFSNGADIELVSFFPDKIQMYYNELSCPMNTTDDFHTYRIVFRDEDFKIYVDGQLKIDGAGRLTHKTKENMLWFGSGGGTATGESYWEYVKFRIGK